MAVGLDEGIIVKPTIELSVPISVNMLTRIPTIAAATTELDGLEGLIGQLYTISVGGRIEEREGIPENCRELMNRAGNPAPRALRTGASHRASGKRKSTRC